MQSLPVVAQWLWLADDGWKVFDKQSCERFEQHYSALLAKGKKATAADKKVKADDQRYIDFSFKNIQELKSHFDGLDDEDGLVGMQRRYDDANKRRAVKREVPAVFAGEKLCLVGFGNVDTAALEELLIGCGATVHPRIIKSVSTVVCLESEFANSSKALAKALEFGIPVVKEKWIMDSLAAVKVAAHQPYVFAADNNGKSKAADDNNDDAAEKPKKKKSKTEAAASSAPAPLVSAASKLGWLAVAPTVWNGVCSYKKANNQFPFNLHVLGRLAGGQINGEVHWPTINNSKTKFRGTVAANGSTLDFEEYEVIGGSDDVEVPVKYTAQCTDRKLVGRVLISDLDDEVTFAADLATVPLEALVCAGNKFSGVAFSPLPFRLLVDTVAGEAATGRIEYTSLAVVTSWSGKVTDSGKHLELTEDKLVSGEQGLVPLPASYKFKLDSSNAGSWKGSFSSAQSDGTVDIF